MAASGLFPKMPAATNVYAADCHKDSREAKMTAWALQGLINQSSAEVYLENQGHYREQLKNCGKTVVTLEAPGGKNAGLRSLFQKYQAQVKKMIVYDPDKEWTWFIALMAAAQQNGIPVTPSLKDALTAEFNWKGEVEDFQNKWAGNTEAYEWAVQNLMPGCSKQVVFALNPRRALPLVDYAVASKGFVFWLNFKSDRAEIEKIFQTKGYGVGTSLMGYGNSGDDANIIANRYGIGYVVSDLYANGSFWSSFPNKTYSQASGKVVPVQPGKIYASIMWSDGDNIQFDQNSLYIFWHGPDHGAVPVATQLSPTLQELNPPLLDWYYSRLTENDELVAGPTGVQFIFIRDFKPEQFSTWCGLTREWCRDAGFHSVRIWIAPNPSTKFTTYMKTCGFSGVFGEGGMIQPGWPPKLDTFGANDEEGLFQEFQKVKPNPKAPLFVSFTCIVAGFNKKDGGYSGIKRQVDRLEEMYPGRYVFLLPKDQFATIRDYYHLPANP